MAQPAHIILVTLEGLPHTGRSAMLRILHRVRPAWIMANIDTTVSPWQSLMRKVSAIGSTTTMAAGPRVVVLSAPWFEHVPQHPAALRLLRRLTTELIGVTDTLVALHVMVHLRASHDESFEQMVASGNAAYNNTTLNDLRSLQVCIAQEMLDAPTHHPFPSTSYTLTCPPFFDDNEATLNSLATDVINIVEAVEVEALKEEA